MPPNIDQKRLTALLKNYIFSQHIGTLEQHSLDQIEQAEWLDKEEEILKTTYRVKVNTNARKIGEPSQRFYSETVTVEKYFSIKQS